MHVVSCPHACVQALRVALQLAKSPLPAAGGDATCPVAATCGAAGVAVAVPALTVVVPAVAAAGAAAVAGAAVSAPQTTKFL